MADVRFCQQRKGKSAGKGALTFFFAQLMLANSGEQQRSNGLSVSTRAKVVATAVRIQPPHAAMLKLRVDRELKPESVLTRRRHNRVRGGACLPGPSCEGIPNIQFHIPWPEQQRERSSLKTAEGRGDTQFPLEPCSS